MVTELHPARGSRVNLRQTVLHNGWNISPREEISWNTRRKCKKKALNQLKVPRRNPNHYTTIKICKTEDFSSYSNLGQRCRTWKGVFNFTVDRVLFFHLYRYLFVEKNAALENLNDSTRGLCELPSSKYNEVTSAHVIQPSRCNEHLMSTVGFHINVTYNVIVDTFLQLLPVKYPIPLVFCSLSHAGCVSLTYKSYLS